MTFAGKVAIRGGGVAAACCHRLLGQGGIEAGWHAERRPGVPAIMLSDPARALMRDCLSLPDLFQRNARINRRIVAWGGSDPVAMPHGAVMLGAGDLDFASPSAIGDDGAPSFLISTERDDHAPMLRFGERAGQTVPVALLREDDADACWVEAVEDGWLFMIPAGPASGWLLAIGSASDELLAQSSHIAARIAVEGAPSRFDTTPRMLRHMTASGNGMSRIACGSSAMAFDPICGDGTALAVRQAILAAGIVFALAEGEAEADLLGHYRAMMVAALRRHLRLSAEFYASGGTGPWWQAQQQAIAEGFAACSAMLEQEPPPRFALEGFRLVRREIA